MMRAGDIQPAAGAITVAPVIARPRPIDAARLRRRVADGGYPFVHHRTCAEWSSSEGGC